MYNFLKGFAILKKSTFLSRVPSNKHALLTYYWVLTWVPAFVMDFPDVCISQNFSAVKNCIKEFGAVMMLFTDDVILNIIGVKINCYYNRSMIYDK